MMDSKMKFILAPILLSEVIGVPNNSVFKAPQRCSSGYTYATTRNTFALTFLLLLTSYRPPRIRANKLFHLSLHLSMPDKTEPTLTSSENVPPFANIITFYSRATRTRRPNPPPQFWTPNRFRWKRAEWYLTLPLFDCTATARSTLHESASPSTDVAPPPSVDFHSKKWNTNSSSWAQCSQ